MTDTVFRVHTQASTHYFYLASSEQALRARLDGEAFWRGHGQDNIIVTPVLGDRQGIMSEVLNTMPESWRYHWCSAKICGCMGCSNNAGSLRQLGFTREEWEQWCQKNPDPRPPVDYEAMLENLKMALSTKH